MMNNIFEMGEVPYDELEYLGVSQMMFDDLPESSLDTIMKGLPSPVIRFTTATENGSKRKWYGRFILQRHMEDDKVHAVVAPKMKTVSFETVSGESYTNEETDILRKGVVIRTYSATGEKYVQLDKVTNQLVMADTQGIDFNISAFTGNEEFRKKYGIDDDNGSTEQSLREGKPVMFSDGEHKATIGVDLLCPSGLRVTPGDSEAWLKKKNDDGLERYSFGNYGCWIKEPDGSGMSYVKDEDYTAEITEAYKRSMDRKNRHGQTVN